MGTLIGSTLVGGVWYGPGDKLPEDVAAQIGEHAFEGGEHPHPEARARFVAERDGKPAPAAVDDSGSERQPGAEPPRKGKGSGKDVWLAFAAEKEFTLDGDPSRDEIIDLMVDAGLIAAEQ